MLSVDLQHIRLKENLLRAVGLFVQVHVTQAVGRQPTLGKCGHDTDRVYALTTSSEGTMKSTALFKALDFRKSLECKQNQLPLKKPTDFWLRFKVLILSVCLWFLCLSLLEGSYMYVDVSQYEVGEKARFQLPVMKENDTHCIDFNYLLSSPDGSSPGTLNILVKVMYSSQGAEIDLFLTLLRLGAILIFTDSLKS